MASHPSGLVLSRVMHGKHQPAKLGLQGFQAGDDFAHVGAGVLVHSRRGSGQGVDTQHSTSQPGGLRGSHDVGAVCRLAHVEGRGKEAHALGSTMSGLVRLDSLRNAGFAL